MQIIIELQHTDVQLSIIIQVNEGMEKEAKFPLPSPTL